MKPKYEPITYEILKDLDDEALRLKLNILSQLSKLSAGVDQKRLFSSFRTPSKLTLQLRSDLTNVTFESLCRIAPAHQQCFIDFTRRLFYGLVFGVGFVH